MNERSLRFPGKGQQRILPICSRLEATVCLNLRRLRFRFTDSSKHPMVTVVIPVFNEGKFIRECLQSVRGQSYKNLECVVIDDAGEDGSREIIEEFVRKDSRFKMIVHETNMGMSEARNKGIRLAAGQYVTFLDADDFLLPHSIWHRVRAMETLAGPFDAGAFCSIVPVPQNGRSGRRFLASFRPAPEDWIDFITTNGENPFPINAPLTKTSILRRFGGFDSSLRYGEDWELWQRILRHGYRFVSGGNYGAVYRQKPESVVRRCAARHGEESLRLIRQAHRALPEDRIVPETPYVFREPIAHYQKNICEARRLVQFAMMAKLAGDEDGFAELVGHLKPGSGCYVARHVDLEATLEAAIGRFTCSKTDSRTDGAMAAKKETVSRILARRLEL